MSSNIRDFIERTRDDTIGFLQVHVRMLEALKLEIDSEERAAGVQDAIDLINRSCETGKQIAEDFVSRRGEILQQKMQTETEQACIPALEACGVSPDKKN